MSFVYRAFIFAVCTFTLVTTTASAQTRRHVRINQFVSGMDQSLATTKMKLNNHKVQSSFIEVGGRRLGFQIPRTVIDIDCGLLCPDLGDAYFYLNDINLKRADLRYDGGGNFALVLEFDDVGREIKGYHSKLGDNGVPDFNMRSIRLDVFGKLIANGGRLTMQFSRAHLNADIQSTGGCNIVGIDICNKLFGSSRKIQKATEAAAVSAMNNGLVRLGIGLATQSYLRSVGIEGTIQSVQIQGNDLILTMP